ncbi:MAG: porin [Nitrospirae bacterium]|nr:porin [Nitrospirota bacterium]
MKKGRVVNALLAIVFMGLMAGAGIAEETKPSVMSSVEEIKNALGMSIYLQGGYIYNFQNPDSQENGLRVFDHKANSFTLDLAQLIFTKDAPMGGVGYKLKVSAGETAKFIHASGLGDPGDAFDLTEAYIDYVAPLGKGLKFRFGKFVTMHGAEVIEAKDDMNYSRSLLFNYAIPFTHTGLMLSYPFSDKFFVSFYVVNGWDNFDDEGSSKTLGLSTGFTPSEQVSLILNLMNGREADLQTGIESTRFLADAVATIKPVKNLTFALNGDYAVQKDSAPDGSDAKWYGIAGYVKYDFSDLFSATVRAEYFKDPEGARTLTPQTAKEITVTPEFRVAKNLIIRPEYRHDWSDQKVFDSSHDSADKKSQDTIALGVMYTW